MKFPTQLTVLRIVLAPLFYTFFVLDPPQYSLAAVIFIVASVTDWYDGYFARKLKLVTRFGSFLDPLADKILTSVAFIAFAATGLIPLWAAIVIISRDIVMTILRVVADIHDLSVRTSAFAKVKTFLQMFYIILLLLVLIGAQGTLGLSLQEISSNALASELPYWGMLIVVLLTLVTFAQYLYDNALLVRTAVSKYILRRSPQN